MEAVGAVTVVVLVVFFFVVESSARTTRNDISRRLGRLEDKVGLLLKQAGLEEPPVARQDEVVALVRSGKKIQAIKVYREAAGVGLAEAKDAVERLG